MAEAPKPRTEPGARGRQAAQGAVGEAAEGSPHARGARRARRARLRRHHVADQARRDVAPAADGISPDEAQQLYSTLVSRGVSARVPRRQGRGSRRGRRSGTRDRGDERPHVGRQRPRDVREQHARSVELRRAGQLPPRAPGRARAQHHVDRPGRVRTRQPRVRPPLGVQGARDAADGIDRAAAARRPVARARRGRGHSPARRVEHRRHEARRRRGDRQPRPPARCRATSRAQRISRRWRRSIGDDVRKLLETLVGKGHVQVVANVDLDTRKIVQTEDLYDKDNTAVRSQARAIEGNDPTSLGSASGIAGVRGNLPGATPASVGGHGTGSGGKIQETTNYEVSHTQRHTENPDVSIKKLHVAILVDEEKGKDGKPSRARRSRWRNCSRSRARPPASTTRAATRSRSSRHRSRPKRTRWPMPAPAKSALPFPMPMLIGARCRARSCCSSCSRSSCARFSEEEVEDERDGQDRPARVPDAGRRARARARRAAARSTSCRPSASCRRLQPGKSVQERAMDAVRSDVERAAGVLTAWLNEAPPKGAK